MIIKDNTTNKYIIIEKNLFKNYYFNIVYKKYDYKFINNNVNYVEIIKTKISKYYSK